jgi:hypothetical protein
LIGAYGAYPRFPSRFGKTLTLENRIKLRFTHSLPGRPKLRNKPQGEGPVAEIRWSDPARHQARSRAGKPIPARLAIALCRLKMQIRLLADFAQVSSRWAIRASGAKASFSVICEALLLVAIVF